MKSSPVVETLEIAKQDERGRRLAEGPERQALIAGYAASGMTQRAFARAEGINPYTFAGWLRKSRLRTAPAKAAPPLGPRFLELGLPRVAAGFEIEVVLPDGVIVRGREVKQLVALIRGLR
jgi:transposase-like protein